jgi:hypothetical protein
VPVEASELDVTSSSSTGVLAVIDEDGAHFYDASGSEFFFVQESGFSGIDFDDIAMDGTHAVIGHVWDDYAALGTAYVYDYMAGVLVNQWSGAAWGIDAYFGASVAACAGRFLIGEPTPDCPGCGSQVHYYTSVTDGGPTTSIPGQGGDIGYTLAIGEGAQGVVGAVAPATTPRKILTYDLSSGAALATLSLPSDAEFGWAYDLDDDLLVVRGLGSSSGSSGHVYVYDARSGLPVIDFAAPGVEDVAVSDGLLAAAGDGLGVWILEASTGMPVLSIPRPPQADTFASMIALDGDRLATTAIINGQDEVRVYSVPRGWNDANGNGFDDACEWVQGPSSNHWYFVTPSLSWTDAQVSAEFLGGNLATVRSQAENDWLRDNFATTDVIWIGYTDQAVEGTFEWASGETGVFENWTVGQPDDYLGADWAVLRPGNGTWFDEPYLPEHAGVVEVISDDCDGNGLPDIYEIALNVTLDWNGDGVLDECSSPNYCTAADNSTGVSAVVGASGSPLIADNAFTLEAWDLPRNKYAYFLASESTAFVPGFAGSSGNLCLGPPIARFNNAAGGGKILNSGTTGTVSFTLDLNNLPQGITFLPGATWYFQLWFRDFTTGPTSNTTDGIEVMFR